MGKLLLTNASDVLQSLLQLSLALFPDRQIPQCPFCLTPNISPCYRKASAGMIWALGQQRQKDIASAGSSLNHLGLLLEACNRWTGYAGGLLNAEVTAGRMHA